MNSLTSAALGRMHELMQIPPKKIIAAVLAGVATLGSAFALAAVSGYLITKAWTMPPVLDLSVAVVSVRAFGISRGVFRYLERMLTHNAALTGVSQLRTNLYTGLATAPDSFVAALRRGELLSRIGDDSEDMANDIIRAFVPGFVAAFMAVVVLGTIAPFSPLAALCMLLGLVIATVIAPALSFKAALITERDLVAARSLLTQLTLHSLDNADVLRVKGTWESTKNELAAAQAAYNRAFDRTAMPAAVSRAGIHIAMIPSLIGSIIAAGAVYNLAETSLLGGLMGHSAGVIGVILLLPLSSFEAASVLPQAASQRARSLMAAERLSNIDPGSTESATALTKMDHNVESTVPQTGDSGHVQLDSAELRTHTLTTGWDVHHPLQHNLDLHFPGGSRTLIYGASGSGKTTLAATLAGILSPVSGEVTLNGLALGELGERELRSTVSFFAEDAHIFATTVRENIRVVDASLDDERIVQVLSEAGLGEWLSGLENGLDTQLGAFGEDVSGGERRRLLLARAIAKSARITILDEPTEHLDPVRADALMQQILTPGGLFPTTHTVIVITHDTRFRDSGARVIDLTATGATINT